MYNTDISGQYLVQSLDYRIHYHYHSTTTVPKYNLLHTFQASYEEAPTNMEGGEKRVPPCYAGSLQPKHSTCQQGK